ncbi:MAG: DsbA family protein [Dinoroseobacter sp.]|nr:DsbA family protein [Dinoroseobacter sp.]
MNKIIAGVAVVLGLGIAAFWYTSSSGTQATNAPVLSPISSAEAQEIDTSGVMEITMGDPNASITVIEYASYTCPHCARFHEDVFKDLKTNYIDTGKINFVYREVYFDRLGLWAGMLARCAGPDGYFDVANLLYEQQADWARAGDPADVATALRRLGLSAGMSGEQIDACLQDGDKAQAMVAVFQQNAEADNVRATPSFFINGEPYSNMSYADFSALLNEMLGE